VVHWPFTIWLCEIKDIPRPSAIGQLKTYEVLYKMQYKPLKFVQLKLVCSGSSALVEEAAKRMGIEVIKV
ncbi:MAG: hypothetical protein ACP5HX_11780, partial [Thermoproteota archaeon]